MELITEAELLHQVNKVMLFVAVDGRLAAALSYAICVEGRGCSIVAQLVLVQDTYVYVCKL